MVWKGQDRRRFPRATYPCLVKIVRSDLESKTVLTQTENLSIGGACVIMKDPVPVFSALSLVLDLLDGRENIHCSGKVVWVKRRLDDDGKEQLSYEVGIEFSGLAEPDHERIEKVVERIAKAWLESIVKDKE